ncbi:unnamed protein product [Amoebophrya sp. A120]|nr:unnamed protein product [Amoebophrya sp. A120]|eukprot:GSA120T00004499001.1
MASSGATPTGAASSAARRILVLYHSRTNLAAQMSCAVASGARRTVGVMMHDKDYRATKKNEESNIHVERICCERLLQLKTMSGAAQLRTSTPAPGPAPSAPAASASSSSSRKNPPKIMLPPPATELLKSAAGFVFVCPENLAAMSGMMKEFFDQYYYHMFQDSMTNDYNGDHELHEEPTLRNRPCGIAISSGSDGENAGRQVERICTGWRLRNVLKNVNAPHSCSSAEEHKSSGEGAAARPLPFLICREEAIQLDKGIKQYPVQKYRTRINTRLALHTSPFLKANPHLQISFFMLRKFVMHLY